MHKPLAWWRVVSCAKRNPVFPCFGFAYLPPPARCHHLHSAGCVCFQVCERVCFITCVWIYNQTQLNNHDAKSLLLWHWSSDPLKYGAPFAVYGSILDSYAAVSFDVAIQQKGNNGRRSPKGERLRISVGSVQKASMPSTQKVQRSPAKIIFRSQGQKWKTYADSSITNA